MREMIFSELSQVLQELARGFAHFLPRAIVLLIIAFAGWLIAYLLKMLARAIFRLIKFDRLSENAGASQMLAGAALPPSSELLSRLIFWIAWFGFILLGVNALGILGLQEQISHFFLFLPRLVAAVFILFFGLVVAGFFSRATLLASVNSNLPSARLLAISVRTIIIVFVLSMVFEELGIAEQTMLVAFGIAFGAVMLGLAIAFGQGGKDLARRLLENKLARRNENERNEDELSPL
jgi:hypothetical protein